MTFRVMLAVVMLPLMVHGQTLIINEVSNGPTGNQEYVEFVVADNALGLRLRGQHATVHRYQRLDI
jgi:hypothetical protein